jgi:hypothetical protein
MVSGGIEGGKLMYDELAKRVRQVAEEVCDDYDVDPYIAEQRSFVIEEAADAIEEMQGKYFLMKKTAEWLAEKVPRWIPVSERLPSAHELVLVYNPGYLMSTGFMYEDGRWRVRSVNYPETPTHWMPLPSTEGLNET